MSRLQCFNTPPEHTLANLNTAPLQAITWEMLETACKSCTEYKLLHDKVQMGLPEQSKDWEQSLLPYYRHRHLLTTLGPVVLINDRPVIPKALRSRAVDHFHSGHPGLSTMCLRLSSSLYWPDYKTDLLKSKLSCTTCMTIAPSNPSMPPQPPVAPQYPFQSVVCDFFSIAGNTYVALADRYSNWLSVLFLKRDTSEELITELRKYFSTFGIPEIFSSDGATVFTSSTFSDFCHRWGIQHRVSSSYFAQSNKRAEIAVKSSKRMIKDSLGPGGNLNTDALARALLAHRNTPDPITGLSPAQVIFGRHLRDFLPCSPGKYYQPRPEWRLTADQREIAHAKRHIKTEEKMSKGSKQLPPLTEGDTVSIQDQSGTTPRRWSKTGTVLELVGPDSYLVKTHGSNRVTQRNRQFLRRIQPYQTDTDYPSNTVLVPSTLPDPAAGPTTVHVDGEDYEDPVDVATSPQSPVPPSAESEILPSVSEHDVPKPALPTLPTQAQIPMSQPLPPHLRERWFVNPNLCQPKNTTAAPCHVNSNYTMAYMDPTIGSLSSVFNQPIPAGYTLPYYTHIPPNPVQYYDCGTAWKTQLPAFSCPPPWPS